MLQHATRRQLQATSGRTPDAARAGADVVLTWLTDSGVQVEAMAAPEAEA